MEGRDNNSSYIDGPLKSLPSISDDVVEKILDKLLVLDGQILSYRSLDVEQIGSVYEGIMGFTVERTSSLCLGLLYRPPRQKVAITCVFNADELLALPGGKRVSWLTSKTEVDLNFSTKNPNFNQRRLGPDRSGWLGGRPGAGPSPGQLKFDLSFC